MLFRSMITVSAVAVTLFLGGWRGPVFRFLPALWPVVWFVLKLLAMIFVFVWVRATVPRIRYDKLMAFGWKVLIPVGLLWILITGAIVALPQALGTWRAAIFITAATVLLITLIGPLFVGKPRGVVEPERDEAIAP